MGNKWPYLIYIDDGRDHCESGIMMLEESVADLVEDVFDIGNWIGYSGYSDISVHIEPLFPEEIQEYILKGKYSFPGEWEGVRVKREIYNNPELRSWIESYSEVSE